MILLSCGRTIFGFAGEFAAPLLSIGEIPNRFPSSGKPSRAEAWNSPQPYADMIPRIDNPAVLV